jgi:hypothetical protein
MRSCRFVSSSWRGTCTQRVSHQHALSLRTACLSAAQTLTQQHTHGQQPHSRRGGQPLCCVLLANLPAPTTPLLQTLMHSVPRSCNTRVAVHLPKGAPSVELRLAIGPGCICHKPARYTPHHLAGTMHAAIHGCHAAEVNHLSTDTAAGPDACGSINCVVCVTMSTAHPACGCLHSSTGATKATAPCGRTTQSLA